MGWGYSYRGLDDARVKIINSGTIIRACAKNYLIAICEVQHNKLHRPIKSSFGGDFVHKRGHGNVPLRESLTLMCAQSHVNTVVDIEPFWVVV